MDCEEAPDIDRPATARAPLLRTADTEARAPEADGENVAPAPEPETAVVAFRAAADPPV
tara:strand:+ start:14593 stop:14769 length:177 start_codon:yes stop_codon:yes gene_type:complete